MSEPLPRTLLFPHPAIWAAIAVMVAVQCVWLAFSDMSLDYGDHWQADLFGLALVAAGYRYRAINPVLSILFSTAALLMLLGEPVRILAYLGTAAAFPLQDANLAAFDRALGFDWRAHVAWVDAHPGIAWVLAQSYMVIFQMTMATVALLCVTRRFARLREFLLLFSGLAIATMVFAVLMPAAGAYPYYGLDPKTLANIPDKAGVYHLAHFTALRDGSLTAIDFGNTVGLITFPSFHTVMPVLCLWALRATRWLWAMLPVAVTMIASTVAIGGHHLADVIAGAGLAVLFIAVLARARTAAAAAPEPANGRLRRPALFG